MKTTPRVSALLLAGALVLAGGACSKPADPGPAADPSGAKTSGPDREQIVAAYDRGLDFLAGQQTDGIWSVQGHPDPGFTSMAVTAMLERPGGPREADAATIDASLAFLGGSLDDTGSVKDAYRPNYMTSVLIMALAASKRPEYRAHIDKAAGFIKRLQRLEEDNPTYGGVGYGSDETRSDLSNTQYALASLRAAGIPEDDPVFQEALVFLGRVQNFKENETAGEPREWVDKKTGTKLVRSNDGGANYYPGNSKAGYDLRPDGVGVLRSYGTMTYALLRCYHLAGLEADDPRVKAATDWISANWTLDHNPGLPEDQKLQGLYYQYATIGKTLPLAGIDEIVTPGGERIDWRAALGAKLVSLQNDDGSWANDDPRWQESLPILATTYALSGLAACAE